jgi:hypothetical protein
MMVEVPGGTVCADLAVPHPTTATPRSAAIAKERIKAFFIPDRPSLGQLGRSASAA